MPSLVPQKMTRRRNGTEEEQTTVWPPLRGRGKRKRTIIRGKKNRYGYLRKKRNKGREADKRGKAFGGGEKVGRYVNE